VIDLRRTVPAAVAAISLFGVAAFGQTSAAPSNDPLAGLPPDIVAEVMASLPAWDTSVRLQEAIGMKHNVVLSHTAPADSGFARGGFDVLIIHKVAGARTDSHLAIAAEGTRYFSSQTVDGEKFDHEARVAVDGEWRYVGDAHTFSAAAGAYHFDTIFDNSNTDLKRGIARLRETRLTVSPKWRWEPRAAWWLEAAPGGAAEIFPDRGNDAQVAEAAVRIGWKPGARLEVSVGGVERRRKYARLEQRSVIGRTLVGTQLRTRDREGHLRLDVGLDAAGVWKATTRAGGSRHADNGSGYFDYRERHVTQELAWRSGAWFAEVRGAARRYDYLVQDLARLFPGFNPPKLLGETFAGELRVERKLDARWTLFGEFRWERNRSNNPISAYRTNESLLGARWSWDK
jgi:hypothetical protein